MKLSKAEEGLIKYIRRTGAQTIYGIMALMTDGQLIALGEPVRFFGGDLNINKTRRTWYAEGAEMFKGYLTKVWEDKEKRDLRLELKKG